MAKQSQIKISERSKQNKRVVTFGAVTVALQKPKADVVARNVRTGQTAFERAAKKLAHAGVSLRRAKDVPLFYVDDEKPKLIVRELNGSRHYGVFKNGKFIASDE